MDKLQEIKSYIRWYIDDGMIIDEGFADKIEWLISEVERLKQEKDFAWEERDRYVNALKEKNEQLQQAQEKSERCLEALRKIEVHIRSTPEPIQHIVNTLLETLPEYEIFEEEIDDWTEQKVVGGSADD